MTISGIICLMVGFFAGLLSCKHKITDYDKAIVPVRKFWGWLKSKVTGKSKEDKKETKNVEEGNDGEKSEKGE